MLYGPGPVSGLTPGDGGSSVWALVAIGFVVAFLAVTWLTGLWGGRRRSTSPQHDVPAPWEEKKAA